VLNKLDRVKDIYGEVVKLYPVTDVAPLTPDVVHDIEVPTRVMSEGKVIAILLPAGIDYYGVISIVYVVGLALVI
jgi:hypothetical protein